MIWTGFWAFLAVLAAAVLAERLSHTAMMFCNFDRWRFCIVRRGFVTVPRRAHSRHNAAVAQGVGFVTFFTMLLSLWYPFKEFRDTKCVVAWRGKLVGGTNIIQPPHARFNLRSAYLPDMDLPEAHPPLVYAPEREGLVVAGLNPQLNMAV